MIITRDTMNPSETHDPHAILGIHPADQGQKVIRIWRPGAEQIHLELFGNTVEAQRVDESDLFECSVPDNTSYRDYRIYHQDGLLAHDPYAFTPTFGEVDQHLFSKGVHYQLYEKMGAHLTTHQGIQGIKFSVWAPSARTVSLIGDFNYWDGRVNPMRSMGASGVWEIFVPGLREGMRYKFEIKSQNFQLRIKADPYANYSEMRPGTASIVANLDRFQWEDQQWLKERYEKRDQPKPFNVYEVHLGSWKKNGADFLNYRILAEDLAAYCREMGYTHIELMPVAEHPLDESWGYQVTGYYAITSRYGTPEDFQFFVNHMHKNNIGVLLDWVPGHFPTDDFSLANFDGTALYEHSDPRQGFHPHWSTYIFNFGRHEVSNFMIANALFWFDKLHIDGLRVDAVASMLYLDYGRDEGQWIPNTYGGKENLEAIEFLKHLNSVVHSRFPGIVMVAEESTSFTGVTHPVEGGGLGFDMKWNMGWMNDTLRYFAVDPLFRHYHQNDITFGLVYAFSERFALVLSHDEVVHGKKSLLSKMPGDLWQKFANLRLLLSYMICHPGKQLLFMGGEIGQWTEWYCKAELDWSLLHFPTHQGLQTMVKDINHFYLAHGELWERDFDYTGFEWVDFADSTNSVISFLRKGSQGQLLCVHNFTPQYHSDYTIRLANVSYAEEIFNSDALKYWGTGKQNSSVFIERNHAGQATGLKIALAPLATMIFKVNF
jgi:1,4-alpha-glucan branching enzyme